MYQRKKCSLNIIQYMQAKFNFIKRIQINIGYQSPSALFNGNNHACTIVDASNLLGHNLSKKGHTILYICLFAYFCDWYISKCFTNRLNMFLCWWLRCTSQRNRLEHIILVNICNDTSNNREILIRIIVYMIKVKNGNTHYYF